MPKPSAFEHRQRQHFANHFSRTYGDYGTFTTAGTFSENFLLPYATPLNISINGREFSNMSILIGGQVVAAGGSFNGQFPSYATTLTIEDPSPQANNDSYVTTKELPVAINPLANDINATQLVSIGSPAHGTVGNSRGGLVYTPAPGFTGTDSFSYTVSNSSNVQASASVTVIVADGSLSDAGPDPEDKSLIEVVESMVANGTASPALLERAEGIALLLNQADGLEKSVRLCRVWLRRKPSRKPLAATAWRGSSQ